MTNPTTSAAEHARSIFYTSIKFEDQANALTKRIESLSAENKQVALAFLENLRGVVQTLSIPINYTCSLVQAMHWQRLQIRERIKLIDVSKDNEVAKQATKAAFEEFLAEDGHDIIAKQVVDNLVSLVEEPASLAAARELVRQGVVLTWSAFEVLARDIFVDLLNHKPTLVEALKADESSRKRFTVDKIDWQTLSNFNFDLSASLGTLLSQRADLNDIQTIRDSYNALFPQATTLRERLRDDRLWHLFQNRNLIVHRRGIVDSQYIMKTGTTSAIGSHLWVSPSEVDNYIDAVALAGIEILTEATNIG